MKKPIELIIKVFLLKDIKTEETSAQICKLIDKVLILDDNYKIFHNENKFKNYCFDMLYPIEKDKV